MRGKKLTTDEIRSCLLGIMSEIDRVSKLLGLNYFLYAGTLLGAVRHKGFIPWDDDVDLCMLRKEYEIFIAKFNLYSNQRYKLIHFSNTRNYVWPFAKVIDTYTDLREYTLNPPCMYGLYVDIFVLDYVSFQSEEIKKEYIKNIRNFNRAQMITNFRFAPHVRKFYNLWIMLNFKGKHRFSYLFADPVINLTRWNDYIQRFSGIEEAENLLPVFATLPSKRILDNMFKTKWFLNPIKLEFEGLYFSAPSDYVDMLKVLYGNYMQLPPENERKGDHFKSVVWRKGFDK